MEKHANKCIKRELYFEFPNEMLKRGEISISYPGKKDGKWCCHLALDYINPEGTQVRGDDELESIVRAIDLGRSIIKRFSDENVRIWWVAFGPDWDDNFIAF